jgi:HPt (histidine-containing phosphotransfer) domain-containing protein
VALSAGTSTDEVDKCIEAGMDGFVGKPFTLRDIQNALMSVGATQSTTTFTVSNPDASTPNATLGTAHQAETTGAPAFEGYPVFHADIINGLLNVSGKPDKQLFERLLDGFENQMLSKISQLRTALESKDLEDLRTTSHAIKSMAANMGAEKLANKFASFENAAKHGAVPDDRKAPEWAANELKRYLSDVRWAVDARTSHSDKIQPRVQAVSEDR